MADAETRIKILRQNIRNGQIEQARLDESIKAYKARLIDVQNRCREKGYDPENLLEEIKTREKLRDDLLKKIEEIMNIDKKKMNSAIDF